MSAMTSLKGRTAVVTGGLRGIGRATALTLAAAGARVAVLDLDAGDADLVSTLRRAVVETGQDFMYHCADVTSSEAVNKAMAACAEWTGFIDILVNNAGKGTDPRGLETLSETEWDRVVALNLKGAYLCSRAAIPHLRKSRFGAIVNLASTAGRGISENSSVPYASAKAGVIGFTRQLARELGPQGIRVNAIAPGSILTGRASERFAAADAVAREKTLSVIPLRKMGQPEDVAQAVLFLASDSAGFIAGAILDVNGGRSMA